MATENRAVPTIEIIAVAFERFGEMKTFVQSWLNQTEGNWTLTIIHDGPNQQFDQIMTQYRNESAGRIKSYCTAQRYNDFGHTLRDMGLKAATGDFVMLTNADNYFIPKTIEFLTEAIAHAQPDVVIFDMIHSHDRPGLRNLPSYSYFETSYERRSIDISSAIVRLELAKTAGFRDKTHDGDATYFEDVAKVKGPTNTRIVKVRSVLLVHN